MSAKKGTETLITYGLSRTHVGGRALTQRQPGNTIRQNVALLLAAGWGVVTHSEYSAVLRNDKYGKTCRLSLV